MACGLIGLVLLAFGIGRLKKSCEGNEMGLWL